MGENHAKMLLLRPVVQKQASTTSTPEILRTKTTLNCGSHFTRCFTVQKHCNALL